MPGFMTSVSSNGNRDAIIWAVSRPIDADRAEVDLYAFNAATGAQLLSQPAGTWPNFTGNANIVPVVMQGKVYVASNHSLRIFGLRPSADRLAAVFKN
jgi:hypothetical protein